MFQSFGLLLQRKMRTTRCFFLKNRRTGGVPKGGPKGSGKLSPDCGFGSVGFGFMSECWSLGLSGLGFLGSENVAKTLKTPKLAKVWLAKVGQHINTLKLAKVDLAKVGQAHIWPGQSWFGQSRP